MPPSRWLVATPARATHVRRCVVSRTTPISILGWVDLDLGRGGCLAISRASLDPYCIADLDVTDTGSFAVIRNCRGVGDGVFHLSFTARTFDGDAVTRYGSHRTGLATTLLIATATTRLLHLSIWCHAIRWLSGRFADLHTNRHTTTSADDERANDSDYPANLA